MTIQDFLNECIQALQGVTVTSSINENYIRSDMIDAIIGHFENKGLLEVKEFTYDHRQFGFDTKEKVTLSTGQEVELNMRFIFRTVTKKTGNVIMVTPTKGKYEMVIGDIPVKFKEVEIEYHIPSYEMENGKVIADKRGFFSFEKSKVLKKICMTDTAKDIAAKVDIASVEYEFDSSLCQPVLKKVLILKNSIPGVDRFINTTTKNIDMKGLADYIRSNMM